MLQHSLIGSHCNMRLEQQRNAVECEIARLQKLLQELTQQQMDLNKQFLAAASGDDVHSLQDLEEHFRKTAEKVVCLVESWYAPAERRAYMGTKEPRLYQSSPDTKVAHRVFHFGKKMPGGSKSTRKGRPYSEMRVRPGFTLAFRNSAKFSRVASMSLDERLIRNGGQRFDESRRPLC